MQTCQTGDSDVILYSASLTFIFEIVIDIMSSIYIRPQIMNMYLILDLM
jgi:hypothetical protein